MTSDLDRLAESCGLVRSYRGLDGNMAGASDEALIALLGALGVYARDADILSSVRSGDQPQTALRAPEEVACYLPGFLGEGRAWGVTCQLYGLRSRRNWGIGDFEDLARLGEIAARLGADFLGVNPLHSLFVAEPQWASPFYPSDRNYLNPLYIAVDRVDGFDPATYGDEDMLKALREGDLVDYAAVGAHKFAMLRLLHERVGTPPADLQAFTAQGGAALRRHALFQTISLEMKDRGLGAGWFGWPAEMQDPDSGAVEQFAAHHAKEINFQIWLQWVADRQLGEASQRLREAGMRIGLYLDLAVGTAPDGGATWSDRTLTVVGAEIGAPPDMFNPEGQKWGLAPVSPTELAARGFSPVRRAYESILRHAGALRIDHAMSLYRLFWIPSGFRAGEGAYALYPMTDIVRALAEVSQESRAIIIGEDLGVVPEGFRNEMQRANLLGYRIFYFERDGNGFVPPERWPRDALACVGSHDTSTLAGWWTGSDISLRQKIGVYDAEGAERARADRSREKAEAIAALRARGREAIGEEFTEAVAVAVHRLVATSPARLVAAQLEDLLGLTDQPNIPGTVDQHPNWRRRLPVAIEDLEEAPMLRAVLETIAQERPRSP